MAGVPSGRILLERQHETERFSSMLDAIKSGGGALLVAGDPGIGKSFLLEGLAESARSAGFQVISASGVPTEAQLPFAALHQLLYPLDEHIGALRPAQAAALRTAIGRADGPAADVYTVALAVLDLFTDVAEARPLLVVVDDMHWVDPGTERVLAFVARRLADDPIVLVAAMRDGYRSLFAEARYPILTLSPLSDGAAEELLRSRRSSLTHRERRVVRHLAHGNPLALMELPLPVSGGPSPVPGSAPALTRRLTDSFIARFRELDRTTRLVSVVAAADETAGLAEVLAACVKAFPTIAPSAAALYPAVDVGLLDITDGRVLFRHPLARSAVYHSASAAERYAAHAGLAVVLSALPERRAWHLAAGGTGPDESVAAQLEQAARAAEHRGARTVAASAWQRAAWFSQDDARKSMRLLRAAEMFCDAGDSAAAGTLLELVGPLLEGVRDRARAALVRDMVSPPIPGDPDRLRFLCDLAVTVGAEADGVDLAARLLLAAALHSWAANPGQGVGAAVMAAADRLPIPADDPRRLSIAGYADPHGYESAIHDGIARMTVDDMSAHGAELVMSVFLVGPDSRVAGLQRAVIEGVRSRGELTELPRTLTMHAWTAITMADWQVALSAVDEATQLAEELEQPLWQAAALTGRAMVDVLCGDEDIADRHLTRVDELMIPWGANPVLCGVQLVRGVSAIGRGQFDVAYTQLRRLFDPADPSYHPVQTSWAIGDLAEAAAVTGDVEDARRMVDPFRPSDGGAASPWTRIALAYARPFLAEPDDVDHEFREVLRSELSRWPSYHARLTLRYGQWLRHRRRIHESQVMLRAAREACDALGLRRWAERARQELRATGETSAVHTTAIWAGLSPQELQIARLAADGLSNREIGQQLYLSHRTVGSHLYRLFPKLGVTTRGQLHAVLEGRSGIPPTVVPFGPTH